jgi:hypothetical protein
MMMGGITPLRIKSVATSSACHSRPMNAVPGLNTF